MVRKKRKAASKKFRYFFLNNKLHKIIKLSKARDEVIAWCYPDKRRVLYAYSEVNKHKQNAYSVKEVCVLLDKHRVTIEEYILKNKIKTPQRVYPIGNFESKWSKFMFSESEILDLHEYILDLGYTKDLPSRAQLIALFKHNIILYTKTDNGFIPVWKAE